ncbi:MAG TPA: hypothetical protein PKA61_05845 [Nitrospira sp.]|nr:hypothetical protein [Nitrospira sp.]
MMMRRLPAMPLEDPEPVRQIDDVDEQVHSDVHPTLRGNRKLAVAWVCTTLLGGAALWYSAASQYSPTVTLFVLIGLLAGYAGYGYAVKKKNTAQFADSLYYMGFLWALFALIAAFVLWPAPKLTTEAVLPAFGYALIMTCSGMVLRLVTLYFQDTLSDRLLDVQDTIDQRVSTLLHEITEANMEISSFRDLAANDLRGSLHDLVRSLSDVREKLAEQQFAMSKTMTAGLESSVKDMLGRLSTMQMPQEILTAEVSKLIAAMGRRGDSFEAAAQKLEDGLAKTAETVASFGESLYGAEGVGQVEAAVNELSDTLKQRTEQFLAMTTAFERSRAELDGQLDGLQSLRASFAAVSSRLSAFETELEDITATSMSADVKNGLLNVQRAIQSSLEASRTIETTMRDVMSFLRVRVTEEHSGDKN